MKQPSNWWTATSRRFSRRANSIRCFRERLRELENRAAERDLTTRAKVALQQKFGWSEERAYMQLRSISRQRRKRIHEIAQEILDDPEKHGH